MLNIILADDHQMVREGVRKLIDAEPDMNVIGDVGDGISTLSLVERLTPDVLIIGAPVTGR